MASKPAAGSAFKHARRIYGSSAKDVPGGTVGKSRLLKESEKLRKSASSGPSPPNLLNETGDFGTKEKDLKGKENEKEKEKVLSRSLLNHLPSMSTGDGDPSWRDTPEEDASTFCCTSEKTNGNDRDSQGRSLTVGSEISVGQSPLQAERSGESGEGAASGNNSLQPPSLFVGMARASESAPPLCELPGTRKGCSVVVRIRPESEVEARAGGDLSTRPSAGQSASAQRGGEGAGVSVVLPESDYDFHFDGVFNMNTTQGEFYSETMGGIPRALLEGYNAAVITYGQTGAGKTFSMLGPMEEMQPGGVVGGAGGAGQKRSVAPSSSSGSVSALGALRDPVSRGAAPRLLEEVFTLIRRRETDVRFEVRASFIEIYNERVQDLLTPSRDNLKIRENRETGKVRAEATEVPVSSCADALSVLETGVANRVQAHTKSNACSSRSHAIFILSVTKERREDCRLQHSQLCLVDLAGSEKLSKTEVEGDRLREAQNINRSLLALGNVIAALAKTPAPFPGASSHGLDRTRTSSLQQTTRRLPGHSLSGGTKTPNSGSLSLSGVQNSTIGGGRLRKTGMGLTANGNSQNSNGAMHSGVHIPYRDSKLTRLLQNSFGGNAFTVVCLCVSPHSYSARETLSTLRFGDRASKVKNKPTVNDAANVEEMQRQLRNAHEKIRIGDAQIRRLKEENERQKVALKTVLALLTPAQLEEIRAAARLE